MKSPSQQLQDLRDKVDELDSKIIQLLETRFQLSREIAELKSIIGTPIHQPEREEEILARLPSKLMHNIFSVLLETSKTIQFEHLESRSKNNH